MDQIKQYWNERARSEADTGRATTNDVFLRKLEAKMLASELSNCGLLSPGRILDVGCGDGQTTVALARQYPDCEFVGIDFSEEMIAKARGDSQNRLPNIKFNVGDVRDLSGAIEGSAFSVIITNRCLINLPSAEEQFFALDQIAKHLVPGGMFVGTENFHDGQNRLNQLRAAMGLPKIPIRWHNRFFDEIEFVQHAGRSFNKVEVINFSSAYYYVTRVVYSACCKLTGETPNYEHPIHQVAINLPEFGDFSPIKYIRASI